MKVEFMQEEFERDFETIVEHIQCGLSPVLIRGKDGKDVVIMSWEDYKKTAARL